MQKAQQLPLNITTTKGASHYMHLASAVQFYNYEVHVFYRKRITLNLPLLLKELH